MPLKAIVNVGRCMCPNLRMLDATGYQFLRMGRERVRNDTDPAVGSNNLLSVFLLVLDLSYILQTPD